MPLNVNKPSFYGRGLAFPIRINQATGSLLLLDARADDSSIGIQYIHDQYEPENLYEQTNKLHGSVANVLLTEVFERDTLPEFGGNLNFILQEPNDRQTQEDAEVYFVEATRRWEHRVTFSEDNIDWDVDDYDRAVNRVHCTLNATFLTRQVSSNLVLPYVTPRDCRVSAWPALAFDEAGHDYDSPLYFAEIAETNGVRHIRLGFDMGPGSDQARADTIQVDHGDTWLTLAYKAYGPGNAAVGYWTHIFDYYAAKVAREGGSRTDIDPLVDPEPGQILDIPSRADVIMQYVQ